MIFQAHCSHDVMRIHPVAVVPEHLANLGIELPAPQPHTLAAPTQFVFPHHRPLGIPCAKLFELLRPIAVVSVQKSISLGEATSLSIPLLLSGSLICRLVENDVLGERSKTHAIAFSRRLRRLRACSKPGAH